MNVIVNGHKLTEQDFKDGFVKKYSDFELVSLSVNSAEKLVVFTAKAKENYIHTIGSTVFIDFERKEIQGTLKLVDFECYINAVLQETI